MNDNKNEKVVIIGASAGGAGVAAKLRRLNEDVEIVLFEKNPVISYATCGIPYCVGKVITDESRLQVTSNEDFAKTLAVDLRVETVVLSINREQQFVMAKDLYTGETYQESYTKLVLAPGSAPIKAQLAGEYSANVFYVRGQEDMVQLKDYINTKQCRSALVVGGGFIGMEMVENLHGLGMSVTVLDKSAQLLSAWDREMVSMVQRHLANKNVRVILNDVAEAIEGRSVRLASRHTIQADIIIFAIGTRPQTDIARNCGLALGVTGGVVVDTRLLTSDENIYALGDVAEFTNDYNYNKVMYHLAGPAQKQARVVAENLCGKHSLYKHPSTPSIVKVMNLAVARVGFSESQLLHEQIPYMKSYSQALSHAEFFPGATSLMTKLLFQPVTGELLGAQIVGARGVDKRIDVLSTALQCKLTVSQLAHLDLSYAPPFSSAKDPVNIAGMVAHNMLTKEDRVLHWDETDLEQYKNALYIDVRTKEEYEFGTIAGAVNIPLERIRTSVPRIPRDRHIILFCGYGKKAYFALKILVNCGYTRVYNLGGGFSIYQCAKARPVSREPNHEIATGEVISMNNKRGHTASPEKLLASIAEENISLFQQSTQSQGKVKADSASHKGAVADNTVYEVDACGLNCPGPVLKVMKTMKKASSGDVVRVSATDMNFSADIQKLCQQKGYNLVAIDQRSSTIKAVLIKP